MTETILEIKNLKNHTDKMKSSKISPSVLKKGKLSQLLVRQVQVNQPFFAPLTCLSHLQAVRFSSMEKMFLKRAIILLLIVKN